MSPMKRSAIFSLIILVLCGFLFVPMYHAYAASDPDDMDYDALASVPLAQVHVGGAVLHVGFAPSGLDVPRQRILSWLERSATAVSTYYGGFPVKSAMIYVIPEKGRGVGGGQAFGYRGPAIRIHVGVDSREGDLNDDWRSVHEMVHLALPYLRSTHNWLSEGLATYVESIARVQAGHLPPARIWYEFVRDMPKGLPKEGDRGLDHTTVWGRTYWGGAIFCLLADVEIRKRTSNQFGLQDAMRAVNNAGGNLSDDWPIAKVIKTADAATGVPVLAELYQKMRSDPFAPDLAGLWRALGVVGDGSTVRFKDSAPLAAIRLAITAPPGGANLQ